jgi:hypothetical protein
MERNMTTKTKDSELTSRQMVDQALVLGQGVELGWAQHVAALHKLNDEGELPATGNPPYRSRLWVDRTTPKTFKPRAPRKSALGESR